MGRDTLELDDDSLFIKKINHPLAAANARLLIRACPFSKGRAFGSNSTPLQAADAVTVAGTLEDLSSTFILRIDNPNFI
jgi:hypothetical protein